MFRTDTKKLYEEVTRGYNQLKSAKNSEERMALANYIGNLYIAISSVQDSDVFIKEKTIFGSHKNYQKFVKKLDIYEVKMLENLVSQQDFHREYLRDIIMGVEDNFSRLKEEEMSKTTIISKEECYAIFHDFMKSINQDNMFDKFYKEGRIYSSKVDEKNGSLGNTEYNPISGETNIFIRNFKYDVHSMFTLAHEFGHVYDFNEHKVDAKTFNKSMLQSFNGEVFSCLFERLFLDFLNNNNILEDDFERIKINTMKVNYNYLVSSYILSLLKDSYLENLDFTYMSNEEIYYIVKNKLKIDFDSIIEYMLPFDLAENNAYAFGDVFSMFLFDRIKKEGFNNELVSKFINERYRMFNKDFIIDNGLSSDNYLELYKKELKLIKK